MTCVLRCADCGFEARGVDREALAFQVRDHAWHAHGMSLTTEDAMRLTTVPDRTTDHSEHSEQEKQS